MKSIRIRRDSKGVVLTAPHWISQHEAFLLINEAFPRKYTREQVKQVGHGGTIYAIYH